MLVLLVLTPLIVSNQDVTIRLVTFLFSGLVVITAVTYNAMHTLKEHPEIRHEFDLNWFLGYLVFGLSVPSFMNLFGVAHDLLMLSILVIMLGFLINNFYLNTKKTHLLVLASLFYGLGTGVLLTLLTMGMFSIPAAPKEIMMLYLICTIVTGAVSAYVVSNIADKIGLYHK